MAGIRRLVVIGGGISGTALAVRALRDTDIPLSVVVVEPRAELGRGLAYSVDDPDHRLNAPTEVHFALPDAQDGLKRWMIDNGGLDDDPDAEAPGGGFFFRRRDFGAYMAALVEPHQTKNQETSGICHLRTRVIDLVEQDDGIQVIMDEGGPVEADVVVLATGLFPLKPPPPFDDPSIQSHTGFLAEPWDLARLAGIDRDAKILMLGTALTTSDIITSLIRQGHRGPINAISRRGLRSQPRAAPTGKPFVSPWPRIVGPEPEFLVLQARSPTVIGVLRALRNRITEVETEGGAWHGPFDELRDSVWQLWPKITDDDKQRYMRHLRPYYDTHRFRLPPQTEKIVADAEAAGQVRFNAARAVAAQLEGDQIRVELRDRGAETLRAESFDAVINCTGIATGPRDEALSRALINGGWARAHPTGMGWDVDADSRAVGGNGTAQRRLFVIGPPSAGYFGDPIGAVFIIAQIDRTMPVLCATLTTRSVA